MFLIEKLAIIPTTVKLGYNKLRNSEIANTQLQRTNISVLNANLRHIESISQILGKQNFLMVVWF